MNRDIDPANLFSGQWDEEAIEERNPLYRLPADRSPCLATDLNRVIAWILVNEG